MDYADIPFPDCIALNAQSAVQWSTTVTAAFGGQVDANQNWQDPLHPFDISFAVRTVSDFALVKSHFMQVRGRASSFPFKDYTDCQVTTAEGVILDAAGAAPTTNATFYLNKRYGTGGSAYDRRITRPDTPIKVYRTRSSVTSDITGAGASVTYTTGAVAITGHMSGDTYSWSGTFQIPCRYDTDTLPAVIVNRVPNGEHLVSVSGLRIIEVRE